MKIMKLIRNRRDEICYKRDAMATSYWGELLSQMSVEWQHMIQCLEEHTEPGKCE